ncbi:DUF4041 domain-containing protein, partial [Staphylococcus epidermidis]
METESFKKQWVMWTILVTSLFSIGTPGIAIIPFVLSIYALSKLIVIKKIIEPDVATLHELKEKNKFLESEIQELQNLKANLMTNIEKGTKELEKITNYLNEELIKYDVELTYPFDLLEVDSYEIN